MSKEINEKIIILSLLSADRYFIEVTIKIIKNIIKGKRVTIKVLKYNAGYAESSFKIFKFYLI